MLYYEPPQNIKALPPAVISRQLGHLLDYKNKNLLSLYLRASWIFFLSFYVS